MEEKNKEETKENKNEEREIHSPKTRKQLALMKIDPTTDHVEDNDFRYSIEKYVCSGGEGVSIFTGTNSRTNNEVIIKLICMESFGQTNIEYARSEIEHLKVLDHPNIVKILEYCICPRMNYIYLVLQLCEGSNLAQLLYRKKKGFSEKDCGHIFSQIALAVNYMHKNNVVHRDLKCENTMIEFNRYRLPKNDINLLEINSDTVIKIIDMETCNRFDQKLTSNVGTHLYQAPEIVRRENYNEKCDMWSMGVILFYMCYMIQPFRPEKDLDEWEVEKNILTCNYKFPEEPYVCDEIKNLIRRMLEQDVNKRMSSEELINEPFIHAYIFPLQTCPSNKKNHLAPLIGYSKRSVLSNLLYEYYIQVMVTDAEKTYARALFKKMDVNCNGILTEKEIILKMPGLDEKSKWNFNIFLNNLENLHKGDRFYKQNDELDPIKKRERYDAEMAILSAQNRIKYKLENDERLREHDQKKKLLEEELLRIEEARCCIYKCFDKKKPVPKEQDNIEPVPKVEEIQKKDESESEDEKKSESIEKYENQKSKKKVPYQPSKKSIVIEMDMKADKESIKNFNYDIPDEKEYVIDKDDIKLKLNEDLVVEDLVAMEELKYFASQKKRKIGPDDIQVMNSRGLVTTRYVKYSEFVVATLNRREILDRDRISKFFKMLDDDRTKEITIENLKNVFDRKDLIDYETWQEQIGEAVNFEDRGIKYAELHRMLWAGMEPKK